MAELRQLLFFEVLPPDLIELVLSFGDDVDALALLSTCRLSRFQLDQCWESVVRRFRWRELELLLATPGLIDRSVPLPWRELFFLFRALNRVWLRSTHKHGWVAHWEVDIDIARGRVGQLWDLIDAHSSTTESFQFREVAMTLEGENSAEINEVAIRSGHWSDYFARLWRWLTGPHGRVPVCRNCGQLGSPAAQHCDLRYAGQGVDDNFTSHSGVLTLNLWWDTAWEDVVGSIPIPALSDPLEWEKLAEELPRGSNWTDCCSLDWSCCGADFRDKQCTSSHRWARCLHGDSVLEVTSINVNAIQNRENPRWRWRHEATLEG